METCKHCGEVIDPDGLGVPTCCATQTLEQFQRLDDRIEDLQARLDAKHAKAPIREGESGDPFQGFVVELWDILKGIRFQMGPNDSSVSCHLVLDGKRSPSQILESGDKEVDGLFYDEDGIDDEPIHNTWFASFDVTALRNFCNRTLAMLEHMDNENE